MVCFWAEPMAGWTVLVLVAMLVAWKVAPLAAGWGKSLACPAAVMKAVNSVVGSADQLAWTAAASKAATTGSVMVLQ